MGRQGFRQEPRAWLTVAALLIGIVGVLSDLGGAVETWKRLVAWLNQALKLPPDSLLAQNGLWILPFLLLLVAVLVALLRWAVEKAEIAKNARHPGGRKISGPDDQVRNRYLAYLSADVENRLRSSIHHARFLDLGLTEMQGATLPWYYEYFDPQAGIEVFGSFDAAFDRFGRRILLLGSPGSGKSTTLLHTALRLLDEARRDSAVPVPVLLNLASFGNRPEPRLYWRRRRRSLSGMTTEEEAAEDRSFDLWLAERLARLPVRGLGAVAPRWIEEGRIALLLDGLDEVEEAHAERLVHTLNVSFLRRYPDLPTVVCSRVIEYQRLTADQTRRLRLDRAVTLQPLDSDQINAYLEAAGATALRDVLHDDRDLYELAQTPLTLGMMTLAYGGLAPTDIPKDISLGERRRHLFDTYIKRMLQRVARRKAGKQFDLDRSKDEPTLYSLEQVNRYLGWLAVRLSERVQSSFVPGNLRVLLDKQPVLDSNRSWTELEQATFLYISLLSLGLSCALLAGPAIRLTWVGLIGPAFFLLLRFLSTDLPDFIAAPLFVLSLGSPCVVAFYFLTTSLNNLLPRGANWAATGMFVAAAFAVAANRKDLLDLDFQNRRFFSLAVISWFSGGLLVILLHRLAYLYWVIPFGAVLGLYYYFLSEEENKDWLTTLRVSSVFLMILFGILGVGRLGSRFLGSPTTVWVAALVAGAIGVLSPFGLASDVGPQLPLEIALGAVLGKLAQGAAGAAVGAVFLPLASSLSTDAIWCVATDHFLQPCLVTLLAVRRQAPWRYQRFVAYATEALLLKRAGEECEFVHRLLRDHFALRDLVPLLYDERHVVRMEVVQRLAAQGESSFDLLADLTHHPSAAVRADAITGLGKIPTQRVGPLLGSVFAEEPEPAVRRQIVESLRKLPWQEIKSIVEQAFEDRSSSVRAAAVTTAAASYHKEDDDLLRRALADSDSMVFRAALCASIPDDVFQKVQTVQSPLFPYLQDISPYVRKNAVRLAGCTEGEGALQLIREACRDSDSSVREAAAEVLGQIRHRISWSPQFQRPAWWLAVEEDLVGLLRDSDSPVRHTAAKALSYPVEPQTVRALVQALAGHLEGYAAASTLSSFPRLADLDTVPLLALLRSKNPGVQAAVVMALGGIKPVSLEPILITWLRRHRGRLRTVAIRALGEMQAKQAVPDLLKIVSLPTGFWWRLCYGWVNLLGLFPADDRVLAAEALGKIGDQAAIPVLIDTLNQKGKSWEFDALRSAALGSLLSIDGGTAAGLASGLPPLLFENPKYLNGSKAGDIPADPGTDV